MTDKTTFSLLNTEVTVNVEPTAYPGEYGRIERGAVAWDALTVNGVEYPNGEANIYYHHRHGFSVSFSLWGGIYGRSKFSDAAYKKVEKAVREAPEVAHLFTAPNVDEVNEYILSMAVRRGIYDTEGRESINRICQEAQQAGSALEHHNVSNPYQIPPVSGLVTEKDIRVAYLQALRDAADERLSKLLQ